MKLDYANLHLTPDDKGYTLHFYCSNMLCPKFSQLEIVSTQHDSIKELLELANRHIEEYHKGLE